MAAVRVETMRQTLVVGRDPEPPSVDDTLLPKAVEGKKKFHYVYKTGISSHIQYILPHTTSYTFSNVIG